MLDLDYAEDSAADTDMNVVMNSQGGFIEVQGTAEAAAFTEVRTRRNAGAGAIRHGIKRLFESAGAGCEAAGAGIGQCRQAARAMAAILDDLGYQLLPHSPSSASAEVAETGTTFVENAIIKARHAALL